MNIKAKKGFTLVELLIVIAVLAILIAAVIIVLNPGEILAQARDSQRLSDISTLTSAMQLYIVQPPVGGIDLGSCPTGGRCTFDPGTGKGPFTGDCDSASGTVRTVDGKGWMDVNFTSMSTGAPIPALPTDPVNNANYFYGYFCTKSANTFEFTSRLESVKYRDKMKTDAGANSACTTYTENTCFYEVGSALIAAAPPAPTNLSYTNNPFTFVAGTPITPLSPTVTGTPTGYSVLPALPSGLFLNPTSGQITGTPTAGTTPTQNTYTVTATNGGGSTVFGVIISVYGTVTLGTQTWLDRNLGATQVATAFDDYLAYGSLFQWGRKADGHQLITWTGAATGTPVNGSTATNNNNPTDSLFITETVSPYDWRVNQSDTLWADSGSTNNPCPSGFHVPTSVEWTTAVNAAPGITEPSDAYTSVLKLTAAGYRGGGDAFLGTQGSNGYYWSSGVGGSDALSLFFNAADVDPASASSRANGFAVRCAKD